MAEEKKENDSYPSHNFKTKNMPYGFNKNKAPTMTVIESSQKKEKVLKAKKYGDRRLILSESDAINVVELTMDWNGTSFGGTGTIYCLDKFSKTCYVITCAHNCVDVIPKNNKKSYADHIWFDKKQTDTKSNKTKSICHVKINQCFVHPKYFEKPTSISGYDLAVLYCKLTDSQFKILSNKKYTTFCQPRLAVNCQGVVNNCYIYGYPVDKSGKFYGMKGAVETTAKLDYSKGDGWSNPGYFSGKIICYSKIDTSGGMSGSPIVYNNDYIVGIHTGGSISAGENWGTELHRDHFDWICQVMGLGNYNNAKCHAYSTAFDFMAFD